MALCFRAHRYVPFFRAPFWVVRTFDRHLSDSKILVGCRSIPNRISFISSAGRTHTFSHVRDFRGTWGGFLFMLRFRMCRLGFCFSQAMARFFACSAYVAIDAFANNCCTGTLLGSACPDTRALNSPPALCRDLNVSTRW